MLSFPNKICLDCHEAKPREEFYASKTARDGLASYCIPCHKARMATWREKNAVRQRQLVADWKRRHPEYQKQRRREDSRRQVLKKYGLTPETYNELLERQNSVCALCGGPEPTSRSLAVDHCHESGRVRGLLCTVCNTALGKLGDTVEAFERVLAYLRAAS
jgi:hypothetical protein